MPNFRCTACGNQVEARVPPIVCKSCQARGKYVEASAAAPAPAVPPARVVPPPPPAAIPPAPARAIPQAIPVAPAPAAAVIAEVVPPPLPAYVPPSPPPQPIVPPAPAVPAYSPPVYTPPPPPPPPVEPAAAPLPPPPPEPPPPPPFPVAPAPPPQPVAVPAPQPVVERPVISAPPAPSQPTLSDRILWRCAPSTAQSVTHPVRGCPVVDAQGHAYIAMGTSLVKFVDGPTPQWSYMTGGAIPRSPVLGSDGIVRVHSTDGYLHLVNADGTRAAEPAPVGPPLGWATPLVDNQNRTWVALADGGLQCVLPDGKSPSRSFYRTRRRFDCTGVIVGEMLYIGAEDHFVHAVRLTADRGDNAWRSGGRTGCPISAPLAVTRKGELLVVSQDDHLYCFGRDGSQLWSLPLPGQVLGSPLVDRDDAIVLAASQTPRNQPARGLLLAIDGQTRRTRWQFATDEPIEGTPVIGDDGVIYCGDNAGIVYAVDRQGQPVWRAAVGAPVRSAGMILGPGIVGFGVEDGGFIVLKCSSQGLAKDGWPKLHGP